MAVLVVLGIREEEKLSSGNCPEKKSKMAKNHKKFQLARNLIQDKVSSQRFTGRVQRFLFSIDKQKITSAIRKTTDQE